MDEFVAELRAKGILAPGAARRVAELDDRSHLPLAREIHALLYLGAALILAGVGAAVRDRLDQLGPMTILAAVGLAAAACYAYCVRTSPPFAPGKVPAPTAAFDYVLYLACGLTGIFFSYLEWKWKPLGSWWDLYLFGSGLLFAALAYRFDNRIVLATGLMNLAAWLGFQTGFWDVFGSSAKPGLIVYGAVLAGAGFLAARGELKAHFEGTFRTLGVHLALATLLTDATRVERPQYWILMMFCAALGARSMSERRFDTFAAAVGYAYLASLASLINLTGTKGDDESLWIMLVSAGAVIAVLLWARARFKEAAS